jgi:hypothetical protein
MSTIGDQVPKTDEPVNKMDAGPGKPSSVIIEGVDDGRRGARADGITLEENFG